MSPGLRGAAWARRLSRTQWLLIAAGVVMVVLTLGPKPNGLFRGVVSASDAVLSLVPVEGSDEWATRARVERVANVVALVPIGFAATRLLRRRVAHPAVVATLGCAAASVAVELVQGWFQSNREASVRDIALNTLGAAIGAGLAVAYGRLARRHLPPVRDRSPS